MNLNLINYTTSFVIQIRIFPWSSFSPTFLCSIIPEQSFNTHLRPFIDSLTLITCRNLLIRRSFNSMDSKSKLSRAIINRRRIWIDCTTKKKISMKPGKNAEVKGKNRLRRSMRLWLKIYFRSTMHSNSFMIFEFCIN